MRTLIDLPQEQINALAQLSEAQGRSRAALIREAVEEYLRTRQPSDVNESFGLWRSAQAEDGVAYQQRLRAEWE